MRKMMQLLVVGLVVGLFAGCSTFGNGKIDPFGVEISLEYHDVFGNEFVFIEGGLADITYQSQKTGVLYQYTTEAGNGSFLITAPDGKTKIRIKKLLPENMNHSDSALTPEEIKSLEAGERDLAKIRELGRG